MAECGEREECVGVRQSIVSVASVMSVAECGTCGDCGRMWRVWRSLIKTNLPIAVTEMFRFVGQNLVWAAVIEAVFFVKHIFLWPLKLYSSASSE